MLSRSIGIVIATWLPGLALILPLSPFHTANALFAGFVAAVLTGFSLASDRARVAAAIVGAWVAFTPFLVRSSLTEIVLCVCWGVTMFVSLAGPFSQAPQSRSVRALQRPAKESTDHEDLRVAA